jgi:hypothetical protein
MDWLTLRPISVIILFAVWGTSAVSGQTPLEPPLPPANEFRVTLAEASDAKLPPDAACGEEAASTLTCRAFTVTLENIGMHTVQLGELDCADPEVRLETTAPTHKKLQTGSWTDSTEDEVKYFSGAAIYVRDFQWSGAKDSGPGWVTDLGNVAFLVNIQLNGKRPRYTLEATISAGYYGGAPLRAESTDPKGDQHMAQPVDR